jgi:hypothetical protein
MPYATRKKTKELAKLVRMTPLVFIRAATIEIFR